MDKQPVAHLDLGFSLADASKGELDMLTRQLYSELAELNIESVEYISGDNAPVGTKAADPITIGALAIAVLPAFLPKLLEFLQAWAARGHGRIVKFKGKVMGQDIEFEGAAEDLQHLILSLSKSKTE